MILPTLEFCHELEMTGDSSMDAPLPFDLALKESAKYCLGNKFLLMLLLVGNGDGSADEAPDDDDVGMCEKLLFMLL